MLTRLRHVAPPSARDALARAALAIGTPLPAPTLGTVTLHPHQQLAVARLDAALRAAGGALLADHVGTGKTFVALALARDHAPAAILVPAALRDSWTAAARAASVPCALVTHESLSHPAPRASIARALRDARLVVVDEAHHLRNPATLRWRHLATLASHARILLLSATPVHNRASDLAAQLALFLGARARSLAPAALARLVVRRPRPPEPATPDAAPAPHTARLPTVAPTCWHRPAPHPADATLCATILALPPPLPPRDGGHAAALGRLILLRLLASDVDALRVALRRRLARAAALDAALADDRHLDAHALRRWCAPGDDVQLGFALDDVTTAPHERDAARAVLRTHVAALRALRAQLDAPDLRARADERAGRLRRLRADHPDTPIVAFTQFADTARAIWTRLAPDGQVALLTSAGGRIASGPVTRRELLARFAPRAAGLPPPPPRERVALLLTTDCVSEGLDLRDAGVVVHLDLPWTPARLAQRVGRAARLGAPHARIVVHALAPPPAVAHALQIAGRLRAKARAAAHVVGAAVARGTRARQDAPVHPDTPAYHIRVAARLERWLSAIAPAAPTDRLLVCVVRAPWCGFLAAACVGATPLLLAGRGTCVSTHGRALRRAVRAAEGAPAARRATHAELRAAVRALRRWHARHSTRDALQAASPSVALARVDAAVASLPAHRRPLRAADAARLRAALAASLPAGVERRLGALDPALVSERWLDAALACLAFTPPPADRAGESPSVSPACGLGPGGPAAGALAVRALVLFVP